MLTSAYLQLALVNTYFDFDDYDSPVNTYLDDRFIYDFIPGFEKENLVFIKQNEAELQDSVYRYTPDGDKKQFVGVDRIDSRISQEEKKGNLITVRFVKDPSQDSYERSVFWFLDFFGNLGGVNEVLHVVGELIVGVFASRLFLFSIISHLYQIDIESKNSNKNNNENSLIKNADINVIHNNSLKNNINRRNVYQQDWNEFNLNDSEIIKNKARHRIINNAYNSMMNRYRYNYTIISLFKKLYN